jgi:hypothetical protein
MGQPSKKAGRKVAQFVILEYKFRLYEHGHREAKRGRHQPDGALEARVRATHQQGSECECVPSRSRPRIEYP